VQNYKNSKTANFLVDLAKKGNDPTTKLEFDAPMILEEACSSIANWIASVCF
jgi:hypothetical protein